MNPPPKEVGSLNKFLVGPSTQPKEGHGGNVLLIPGKAAGNNPRPDGFVIAFTQEYAWVLTDKGWQKYKNDYVQEAQLQLLGLSGLLRRLDDQEGRKLIRSF